MRLIDEKGEQIGIMETRKAIEMAQSKGFDLMEISPQAVPPVCKILDYGQYQYQKQKKEQKAKKKHKKTILKGIRLSFNISKHDLEFKAKQAEKFLTRGHKVKVELLLRGREHTHLDLAFSELKTFQQLIQTPIKVEQFPKKLGDRIIMILANV